MKIKKAPPKSMRGEANFAVPPCIQAKAYLNSFGDKGADPSCLQQKAFRSPLRGGVQQICRQRAFSAHGARSLLPGKHLCRPHLSVFLSFHVLILYIRLVAIATTKQNFMAEIQWRYRNWIAWTETRTHFCCFFSIFMDKERKSVKCAKFNVAEL